MPKIGTIYSIISCGLGNQLFQYAHGLALSEKFGMKHAVILDELPHTTSHYGYQLPLLLKELPRVASNKEIFLKFGLLKHRKIRRMTPSHAGSKFSNKRLIQEAGHEFKPVQSISRHQDYMVRGFWQSEKNFINIERNLRNNIENKIIATPDGWIGENLTSIHIRGGDYLNSKNSNLFAELGAAYYEKAISEILRNDPDARFALFSDDFVYARSILPNNIDIMEITQNSGPKSYVDMLMMSRCKNNIISNSTFSWWGAWLNDTNGKTIIAPSNWFHPSSELIDSDIVPSTWIKI